MFPKIIIKFCVKCKWQFRATWYFQELISTFADTLGEVDLVPCSGGVFTIQVHPSEHSAPITVWDRKEKQGFPDSKELKRLVRDIIDPETSLGHVDRLKEQEGLVHSKDEST